MSNTNSSKPSKVADLLNKHRQFKKLDIPPEFTAQYEFHQLYKHKLAQAGEWVDEVDEAGNKTSSQWIPFTTYLVCPQNRQLVLNNEVNINMIHILEPISDEDAAILEATYGGAVGIPVESTVDTQDVLARMGISRDTPKTNVSKQAIIDSDI